MQINFSRSIDPIVQQEVTITRQTVTRIEDIEKERTMGRKHIVPYGLYRVEGYISAKLANDANKGTGFSEEDLDLLWDALVNMFEHDHSAARGKMATRKLIVFKHASDLGNAPSHLLFERVDVERKAGVTTPRSFSDIRGHGEQDRPARWGRTHREGMTTEYPPDDLAAALGHPALHLLPPAVGADPCRAPVAGECAHCGGPDSAPPGG